MQDGLSCPKAIDRDERILSHRRLVWAVARGYRGRGLEMDDLVGEGTVGLILAAEDFNSQLGGSFGCYASRRIGYAIRDALGLTGSRIRLPNHVIRLMARFRRGERALRMAGVTPTFEDIVAVAGLDERQRLKVSSAIRTREWAEEVKAEDFGRPEEADTSLEDAEILAMVGRLDRRQQALLELRFFRGLHLGQIGQKLDKSREWARREINIALATLREMAGVDP